MPHVGNFPIIYFPKPLSIGPPAFVPGLDTYDYEVAGEYLRNQTSLTEQKFLAPVVLPDGVTISKVTLFGYRLDALASLGLRLVHHDRADSTVEMCSLSADWSDGYGSVETPTITDPVIDNENRDYFLSVKIDPNDDVMEVRFNGALIDWG